MSTKTLVNNLSFPAFNKKPLLMKTDFTRKLLKWNSEANKRSMPWKEEKDPYKIWLSEIILQQTRVEQGMEYYNKYIKAFPTIHHLAKAPNEKVFKLWEGLGYYSRCKNLISTAKVISNEYSGEFPKTYENIRSLKGVGPYTAAAIASFAYDLPHAVVDGNVFRILARYFGITTPIDNAEGRKLYSQLAEALLYKKQPGVYNQAIMDFGATVCKPKNPLCNQCVQRTECEAFKNNWVNDLPVKHKKLKKKTRWMYYFIVRFQDNYYIRKRTGKDIWQNLFEFTMLENDGPLELDAVSLCKQAEILTGTNRLMISQVSDEVKQQLTHQTIIGHFISVTVHEAPAALNDYLKVPAADFNFYAFPAFINSFLTKNQSFL
jgi:A/G-specific adenine glycosylase